MKKSIRKKLRRPFTRLMGHLCYNSRYLKGKQFTSDLGNGWSWVAHNWFIQKVVGVNRHIPFPVDFRMKVGNWKNIEFDMDNLNIFQKVGNYYQATDGKIVVGKDTWIANGVAIITTNHDLVHLDRHVGGQDVVLGKECWIGSNAVILPGVRLGEHTVVGAGAVVTKSFEEGWCVIGGVPARKIKDIERPAEETSGAGSDERA